MISTIRFRMVCLNLIQIIIKSHNGYVLDVEVEKKITKVHVMQRD